MIKNNGVLLTSGAVFTSSNLSKSLFNNNNFVKSFYYFTKGKREKNEPFLSNSNYSLTKDEIRDLNTCKKTIYNLHIDLHKTDLSYLPRFINYNKSINKVSLNMFLIILLYAYNVTSKHFLNNSRLTKLKKLLINLELPTINGYRANSKKFNFIENVIQMNQLTPSISNPESIESIFNTSNTDIANLAKIKILSKVYLNESNAKFGNIEIIHIHKRLGDILYSLAYLKKASRILV